MSKTKKLVLAALTAAFMCILSPISIPLGGGVGIGLGIFVVVLTSYLLEVPMCVVSCGMYLLIGLLGLPVFAGFNGGVGAFVGPTGGFLIGYIFVSLLAGVFAKIGKGKILIFILGTVLGLLICYSLGTLWYMYIMKVKLVPAIFVCVVPYVIFDLVKIAIACVVGPILKKNIKRA